MRTWLQHYMYPIRTLHVYCTPDLKGVVHIYMVVHIYGNKNLSDAVDTFYNQKIDKHTLKQFTWITLIVTTNDQYYVFHVMHNECI